MFLHAARLNLDPARSSDGALSRFNAAEQELDYRAIVDSVLSRHQIGSSVGVAWQVDQVMRWVSAAVCRYICITMQLPHPMRQPAAAGSKGQNLGRTTVRAETVQAIMGAVFHLHVRLLSRFHPLPDIRLYRELQRRIGSSIPAYCRI